MKYFYAICLVVLLVMPAISRGVNIEGKTPLTPEQNMWLTHAEKHQKDGWIYLHIVGSPAERGFQYGYLLADEIAEALRVRRELWKYWSSMDWDWLLGKSKKMFSRKVDPESRAEIDGIVEGLKAAGVNTSRDEMIAYNGFFDLAWYWWPEVKEKIAAESPSPPKQSCSAFIAAGSLTNDGGIVMGHNTWFDFPEADFNVVLDIKPTEGHRILMQTAPGWIHSGSDFFITDAGLMGTETTIGAFKGFDEKGIPEFVRFRRATQDASSIDEWCDIMKKGNNGGYANAWLLGDVKTNEIARLELGLKYAGFEKKKDGYFIGSNVAEDLKILRLETTQDDQAETDIHQSTVARRERWKQLMRQFAGKIDLDVAKQFLADHYDTYLGKDNPSRRSLCGHSTEDPQFSGSGIPFYPSGAFDGKVVDTKMAKQMSFAARWGSSCGKAFDAGKFLEDHPQFDWMRDILRNRPSQPWTEFHAGEK